MASFIVIVIAQLDFFKFVLEKKVTLLENHHKTNERLVECLLKDPPKDHFMILKTNSRIKLDFIQYSKPLEDYFADKCLPEHRDDKDMINQQAKLFLQRHTTDRNQGNVHEYLCQLFDHKQILPGKLVLQMDLTSELSINFSDSQDSVQVRPKKLKCTFL